MRVKIMSKKTAKKKKKANYIKNAMKNKIIKIEKSGKRVSRHGGDFSKLAVVDISPRSIKNQKNYIKSLNKALKSGDISKRILPSTSEPAYHIEIPIKNE